METINLKQSSSSQTTESPKPGAAATKNWFAEMSLFQKIATILGFLVFLYAFFVTLDANKYRAQVYVAEGEGKIGVNPTTERLDFGDLSRGSSAIRRIRIKNATAVPMWIVAIPFGDIADVIKSDKNFFVLKPTSETEIEFRAYMPASAPVGEYVKGRVFLFKFPGPW